MIAFFQPPTAVYPRWRGEHAAWLRRKAMNSGLSPLARGTQIPCREIGPELRFIPAGAGNTGDPANNRRQSAVYPRWRGEHIRNVRNVIPACGLSPLARGTLRHLHQLQFPWRFIPAGAGNTIAPYRLHFIITVYPRWRGEHAPPRRISSIAAGLSPLARGTLLAVFHPFAFCRFIPAGAGNTFDEPAQAQHRPVYPRWRGEHVMCTPLMGW